MVAILLFSIGAGISIIEGLDKIQHPHPVESPYINFIVLGLAFVFEGYALRAAVKAMNTRRRAGESALSYTRRSKDAPLVVVLLEDAGALIGLSIAAIALAGALVLDMPELDGAASVAIGVLLACAAIVLFIETKALLIGEAASPGIQNGIRTIIMADCNVLAINEVLTMYLGPEDIFCALSVDFKDEANSASVEVSISAMEQAIKAEFSEIKRVFVEAQSVVGHAAALAAQNGPPPSLNQADNRRTDDDRSTSPWTVFFHRSTERAVVVWIAAIYVEGAGKSKRAG